jgi:uncharacterized alkaline shock family protein YloU
MTEMTAPTISSSDKTRGELAHREDTATVSGRHGHTTISDIVVQKIAGLATREISGVYALGGGGARAFGALRERIPGASASSGQGVDVEVGERQAAADLSIVVEYGVAIGELSKAVRRNVTTAIERMTGLEVVEVNIHVNDVHIPEVGEQAVPTESARVL